MKRTKSYQQMTSQGLAAATAQFDEEFVVDRSRPLTAADRKRWQSVKRKRGRPKSGQGYRRISVSIEGGLLKKVTALAKKRRISRSRLLADVLSDAISSAR